jgi:hypothetical protein
VPCVTKWQYPLTDGYLGFTIDGEHYTSCSRKLLKILPNFKALHEFNMFYVKPAGNAVKYDESRCKGA